MTEFKSFFKTVTAAEGQRCKYPTRLDLYGCGCFHDCDYCYAKSLLDFRGLWHPAEPAAADIQKVRRKLDKVPAGTVLRLGGMTDCFQPCERQHQLTRQTIGLLNERGIGYLIVTKSDMVAEYMDIMDKQLAHIQVSTTWLDCENAAPTERRISAIETLFSAGFDVAVRLSPFVPEKVDFDRLNSVKCDKIQVEFLRVNHWIRKWMPMDYSEYTLKSGGYHHLPLELKKEYLKKITGFSQMSICEDVEEHYIYWQQHVNPNMEDCCNLRKERQI